MTAADRPSSPTAMLDGAPETATASRATASARSERPVRTLFFGSGAFAVPALEALVAAPEIELVAVVSAPDRPAGRHGSMASTPVAARARELGLELLQPARIRERDAVSAIAVLRPALGVLADYGRIVPRDILAIPPLGILNLHPSLLPRHRGATPIAGTILAGDPVAGVTLFRMDEGLDTGPILAAVSWPLDGTETAPQLEDRAAAEAARLLRVSLPGWLDGSLGAHAQAEAGVTMTNPLRRSDGRLDPSRPAARLERQVRAFQPWPGSFLETLVGRIVVWRASVAAVDSSTGRNGAISTNVDPAPALPGEDARALARDVGRFVVDHGRLALVTSSGLLVLDEVQPAGGRRMTGAELLRGRPTLSESRVLSEELDTVTDRSTPAGTAS